MLHRTDALRYFFWAFWFFLVPAAAAYGLIIWLSANDLAGPLDEAAREQSVPAGIVAFTLFEGVLWYFRHRLPFASPLLSSLAAGGGAGLTPEMRKELETASHLCEEAERTIAQNRTDILSKLGEAALAELDAALGELSASMKAEPFEHERFTRAFSQASTLVNERLAPWRKSELREYIESIGVAILVALLLRAVVVEAFKIPSGSMKPTLQINDHIFVSKFSYGPKLPLIGQRIFESLPPNRGDVIVFEYPDINPNNERQDYIKRVMALPGDTLEVDSGHPIINGWRVPSCKVGKYTDEDPSGFGQHSGDLFVEYLGDTAYLALYDDHHFPQRQGPYHVAPGEVWVMGDNRHNSLDSRAWQRRGGGIGAGVPYDNIKGRAMIVWFPASRMLVNVMGKPTLPESAPAELVAAIDRCLEQRPSAAEAVPPPPSADSSARGTASPE
ncbi:MAG TPA: signal peptidase I [Polyangiaceae bacterium]|nr:signal peptidase I [Polyangiaceae bacterium]